MPELGTLRNRGAAAPPGGFARTEVQTSAREAHGSQCRNRPCYRAKFKSMGETVFYESASGAGLKRSDYSLPFVWGEGRTLTPKPRQTGHVKRQTWSCLLPSPHKQGKGKANPVALFLPFLCLSFRICECVSEGGNAHSSTRVSRKDPVSSVWQSVGLLILRSRVRSPHRVRFFLLH